MRSGLPLVRRPAEPGRRDSGPARLTASILSMAVAAVVTAAACALAGTPQATTAGAVIASPPPSGCAQGGNAPVGSTLRVCPGSGPIGSTVVIEGTACNSDAGPAIIAFGGPVGLPGGPAPARSAGATEVGRLTVDSARHFMTTFTIPRDLDPIQGAGGGGVEPGTYAVYSKPLELCFVVFVVTR